MDTRCLAANQGALYEINAFVKLVDTTSGDPERCPQVGIFAYSPSGSLSEEPVATITADANTVEGYQLVQGVLEFSEEMATASSVLFYIEQDRENLAMLVDDVSMKRTHRASTSPPPEDIVDDPVSSEASTTSSAHARIGMNGLGLALVSTLLNK